MIRSLPTLLLTLFMCALLGTSASHAEESRWDAVGVRAGLDLTDRHGSHKGNFRMYEAFGNYLLPWSWSSSSGLELRTRVDASGSLLEKEGTRAFVGTLGPGLALEMFSGRMEIDAGVSAAGLSRHDFPGRNLGSSFLFNLHGGIGAYFFQHFGIGYHYEHMSNAYLYNQNPGLNLHMVEVKYRF
jgi:hypothetical protein